MTDLLDHIILNFEEVVPVFDHPAFPKLVEDNPKVAAVREHWNSLMLFIFLLVLLR
jgi:hypothetical protein